MIGEGTVLPAVVVALAPGDPRRCLPRAAPPLSTRVRDWAVWSASWRQRCDGGRGGHRDGQCQEKYSHAALPLTPQIWNDYKLKWNPSDYDGTEFMRVPAQKIWKPDIVLYNK